MGLSDEDLEGLTSEMMSAFEGAESMEGLLGNLSGALGDAANSSDDDEEEDGRTATFPFLNKLMGNLANPDGEKKEDALPRCLSPGRGWRPQCPRGKNRAQKPDQAEIPGKSLYLPHPKSRRGKVGSDELDGIRSWERSFRSSTAAKKTIPASSENPAWEKPPLPKGWR